MAPAHSIVPTLPPSVEEAYRRKCIQLKQRSHEIEEANDAARVRLQRIKRQVDKLRLERAFLLEQLAKRTSTNVEDSEGSPSPPPTPKEKPLRTKRGHRKPSVLADIESKTTPGSTFISQIVPSPSSESFLAQGVGTAAEKPGSKGGSSARTGSAAASGKPFFFDRLKPPRPETPFELWIEEKARSRPFGYSPRDDDEKQHEENAQAWRNMDDHAKERYQKEYDANMVAWRKDMDRYYADEKAAREAATAAAAGADKNNVRGGSAAAGGGGDDTEADGDADGEETQLLKATQDEDVEMGNYDTEDAEDTQLADKADD